MKTKTFLTPKFCMWYTYISKSIFDILEMSDESRLTFTMLVVERVWERKKFRLASESELWASLGLATDTLHKRRNM